MFIEPSYVYLKKTAEKQSYAPKRKIDGVGIIG